MARLVSMSLTLLCLILAAPAPVRGNEVGAPLLHVVEPQVAANETFRWEIPLVIANAVGGGLYLDSLALSVEDLDPGETRASRVTVRDLTSLLGSSASLSPGDSSTFIYQAPATAESARISFTLRGHDANGTRYVSRAEIRTSPGPGFGAYPSTLLHVGEHVVETVFVPAPHASAPVPGLLLVHGHGNHARLMIPFARSLAEQGYGVMLVSLPGYGRSSGPADLGGPASQAALEAALAALAKRPDVDRTRLGAWGLSRGAGPVVALAATHPELRAVVAQSGIYDLWAVHRGTTLPGFAETIVAEAGRDSAAWRARSPLRVASRVTSPMMIVHGEKDPNVPAGQAHALADALARAGHPAETLFAPNAGHAVLNGEIRKRVLGFLDRQFAAR